MEPFPINTICGFFCEVHDGKRTGFSLHLSHAGLPRDAKGRLNPGTVSLLEDKLLGFDSIGHKDRMSNGSPPEHDSDGTTTVVSSPLRLPHRLFMTFQDAHHAP